MQLLNWMDTAMPKVSNLLAPMQASVIGPVFGGVGGLIVFGFYLLVVANRKVYDASRWGDYAVLMAGALILPVGTLFGLQSAPTETKVYFVGLVVLVWLIVCARRLGNQWIAWPFLFLGGMGVFWQELWRLPLALLVAFSVAELLRAKKDAYQAQPWFQAIAGSFIALGVAVILLGNIWSEPTGQFANGAPAWLGNQDLVIPAILFWGFPWVGTVGVLIYLSGLQNISQDVYEAARLDGVSPLGMIFKIELPLIMTQVRINLIFMTIGTLATYEIFLILLGSDGGPGGKGMVPGLYMFSAAFSEARFGYACALGMVLFIIILLLTIVYQKYVKVDK